MSILPNKFYSISESTAVIVPIVLMATVFGASLVFSSEMGFKWFFLSFLGISLACVATIFYDFRLFLILLVCACIPVDIQYNPFKNKKFVTLEHWGGAPAASIVHLVDFSILLLFILWLVDLGFGNKKLPGWCRFDTYCVTFLCLISFSIINTDEYLLLFCELFRYLKYYLLLWILRTYLDNITYYWWALAVVVLMVLLESMIACLQYFLFFSLPVPVGGVTGSQFELVNNIVIQRVTGLVGFSNTFAAYLLFPIITSFVIMISESPLVVRLVSMVTFVAGCVAIVVTFSRNSWMVLAGGLLLVTVLGIRYKKVSLALIVGLFGLACFVVGFLYASGVLETILVRVLEDNGKAYDSRYDLFMVAVEIFKTFPIFGAGLNTFEEIMSKYDFSGVTNIIQQPVHNVFFLYAAETGVFAAFLFIVIGFHIANLAKRILLNKSNLAFIVGCSTYSLFITLGIDNFFDITMRKDPIIGMMTIFIAMVLSFDKLKNEKFFFKLV